MQRDDTHHLRWICILLSLSIALPAEAQFGKGIIPGLPIKIPGVTPDPEPATEVSPAQRDAFLQSLGESNNRLGTLRKEMEAKYYELHKETLRRVEGLFYPAVETYSQSLVRIQNDLPELSLVREKLGELIQSHVPTTSADTLDAAATEMSRISVDGDGRLDAAFDEVVKVLAKQLSGDQQVAYFHSCEAFASNMRAVGSEWKRFGPDAKTLFEEAKAKKSAINKEFRESFLKVTTFLSINVSLNSLVTGDVKNIEEKLLQALGASATGQAPEAVRIWIENTRFWKGLGKIQNEFDSSFTQIGKSLKEAETKSGENRKRIEVIARETDSDYVRKEAEKAIANLRRPSDEPVLTLAKQDAPAPSGDKAPSS
jgi:hypothetical protein